MTAREMTEQEKTAWRFTCKAMSAAFEKLAREYATAESGCDNRLHSKGRAGNVAYVRFDRG